MRTFLLSGVLLSLAATSGRADLTDNFNSENGGGGQLNYSNFANFFVANTAQGGTVDLIGNGFFDFYPGNGLYIDLLGSGNGVAGLLTTDQIFGPGTYNLSFDLAGSQRGVDNDVAVKFGTFSQTYHLPSSQGYTLETATVTLTTAARLSFQDLQTGDEGAILDNVSVISTTKATPEPSTLCLAGFGAVCGITYVLNRKRKALQVAKIKVA
jgi:hypothetical protein